MGKIFTEKRWLIIAVLLALAGTLPFLLTQHAFQRSVVYCDYHVVVTKGPSQPALWVTDSIIGDSFCGFGRVKAPPSKLVMAFHEIGGLFPRDGISWIIALCAGMIAPVVCCLVALALALRRAKPMLRRGIAVLVCLPGFGVLALLGQTVWWGIQYGFLVERLTSGESLFLAAFAMAFLGSSIWICFMRPVKDPA